LRELRKPRRLTRDASSSSGSISPVSGKTTASGVMRQLRHQAWVAYLGLPGVLVWDGERDNRGVLGGLDRPPGADDAPVTLAFLPR
jgi:hypothetical protein